MKRQGSKEFESDPNSESLPPSNGKGREMDSATL